MKKTITLLITSLFVINLFAQDLNISHYPFYRDGFNPGSFLQSNDVNVFVLFNKEFFEFSKQPTTQLIDVSFNLGGKKLGLTVYNDKIGFNKTQNVRLRYAQQFKLTEKAYLSMGLGAGAVHNFLSAPQMTFENDNDPLKYLDYRYTQVDFDFGAEIAWEKLTMGLSVLHLGKQFTNPSNNSPAPHYYFYTEYSVQAGSALVFFPNILFRKWTNTFWAEAGIHAFYKNNVWFGATYTRHNDLTLNTGLHIAKNILFGYAFKTNLDPQILKPASNDSHEVFLNFAIQRKKHGLKTPRFID